MLANLTILALAAPTLVVREDSTVLQPPESYMLGGYTARGSAKAQPGGEPLYCRILSFQSGDDTIVIASLEMLTVPESLYYRVRQSFASHIRLFLTATHTHCAPDSQMLNARMTFAVPGIARYDSDALGFYANHITKAISNSLSTRGSSATSLSYTLNHAQLNCGRRRLAEPITELGCLSLGKDVLWTSYAAHAVFHGPERMTTSGDWPGRVSSSTGSLTLIGPIGDVSPAAPGERPSDRIENFVTAYRRSLNSGGPTLQLDTGQVKWASVPIDLESPSPSPVFAREFGIPEALATGLVNQFAPKEASISAFRIGKLAVVGVPGEPSSALGRRIRDAGLRLGFRFVLVVSHVNGWIGYILEPADRARGGYEAALGFHGESAADRVADAAIGALRELRN